MQPCDQTVCVVCPDCGDDLGADWGDETIPDDVLARCDLDGCLNMEHRCEDPNCIVMRAIRLRPCATCGKPPNPSCPACDADFHGA